MRTKPMSITRESEKVCRNCVYFTWGNETEGLCRINPPGGDGNFPIIYHDDWCADGWWLVTDKGGRQGFISLFSPHLTVEDDLGRR